MQHYYYGMQSFIVLLSPDALSLAMRCPPCLASFSFTSPYKRWHLDHYPHCNAELTIDSQPAPRQHKSTPIQRSAEPSQDQSESVAGAANIALVKFLFLFSLFQFRFQ